MDDNSRRQPISTEELLRLVAHPCRRELIEFLMKNGDRTIDCDELCRSLRGNSGSEISPEHSEKTRLLQLQHTHLPKLADAGVIEYDPHRKTVQYQSIELVEKLIVFIESELR